MRPLITHMHSSVLKEMGETEPSGAEWGAEETPQLKGHRMETQARAGQVGNSRSESCVWSC